MKQAKRPDDSHDTPPPSTSNRVRQFKTEMHVRHIAASADGRLIAIANGDPVFTDVKTKEEHPRPSEALRRRRRCKVGSDACITQTHDR